MTIACGQGWYWGGNECGALHRLLFNIPTFTQGDVASYVYDHHLLTLDGYHNVGYKIPTDQLIRMYLYLYKFI